MAHYVIYLPGFGDTNNSQVQIRLLNRWRKFGVEPRFQSINWSNNENFESKLARILEDVDELIKQKHKVSLVGISAGATMAINTFSARKDNIDKVVFICGKINNPQNVRQYYFQKNPAFKESLEQAAVNLQKLDEKDKSKMLSIHPIYDEVVYVRDAKLAGAKSKTIFSVEHALSIFLALSLYKKVAINFIKAGGLQ
jgi:pimeloyl-ACP methyl ester carboxylesterase